MALTAAQAHTRLRLAARNLSNAKRLIPEDTLRYVIEYDTAYRLYTNPFGVDKYAPAITPKN